MKRCMAVLLSLAMLLSAAALAERVELSGCYGGEIAEVAKEIGGLSFSAGEEFDENYDGETLALRGREGRVRCIELKDAPSDFTLCGIAVGMGRDEAERMMAGSPQLWRFDEEIAWIARADSENELDSETLVVFFDEKGRVNGAWYRSSEA